MASSPAARVYDQMTSKRSPVHTLGTSTPVATGMWAAMSGMRLCSQHTRLTPASVARIQAARWCGGWRCDGGGQASKGGWVPPGRGGWCRPRCRNSMANGTARCHPWGVRQAGFGAPLTSTPVSVGASGFSPWRINH